MADKKAQGHLDTWESISQEMRLHMPTWQEQSEFIQPRKSNILIKRSPGQRQTDKMYNSTAFQANELLAASMQGSLTSAALPWFSLRIRGLELDEDNDITRWLEQSTSRIHDALRQSNFNPESHELYSDLSCFGTGMMFEDAIPPRPRQRWMGVRFQTMPPGTFAIDEDTEGRVNMVYMMHNFSARAAVARFGEANVGEVIQKAATAAKQDKFQTFPFLHAIYPRAEYSGSQYNPLDRKVIQAKKLPYGSCWVDVTSQKTAKESGFHENPCFVPRWAKSSGERFGRGPGHIALPDVKTLNKVIELKLRGLAKIVNPPTKVRHDGILGQVDLTASGITYVHDMDAVESMDLKINLERVDFEEAKLKQDIRAVFFSDQLQLQDGPQMTAYEVQVRYELMQRILGPTLGRLEVEFLSPLIERTFWIMFRAEALPPMPESLEAWLRDGNQLDIEYEGPLARAQRLSETVANQRLIQFALPVIQADPETADVIDLDELLRDTAENVGVKRRVLRSKAKVEQRRAERRDQEAQQAQAQAAYAGADAMGKAAPMVKALQTVSPGLLGTGAAA